MMPPVPVIPAPAPMMPPVPTLVPQQTDVPKCQWCGQDFPTPVVQRAKGKGKGPRPVMLDLADHEVKCASNPHRPEVEKESKAWNPRPWMVEITSEPVLKPTTLTFLGGPWHGRQTRWEMHLVSGECITIEPPAKIAGPVKGDSKERACSAYMGHYELRIREGCPVYRWVDTIIPKKRLSQPTEFTAAFPELAATLMEDIRYATEPGTDADGVDEGGDLEVLG